MFPIANSAGASDQEAAPAIVNVPNATLAAAQAQRSATLDDFARRRLARTVAVPTDDDEVRKALRAKGEPVCLFGEDAHDRRERLRELIVREILLDGKREATEVKEETKDEVKDEEEGEFYTEGDEKVKLLRLSIAKGSLFRAHKRIAAEKVRRLAEDGMHPSRTRLREAEHKVVDELSSLGLLTSQSGAGRPLTCISTMANTVVTGALDGAMSTWRLPQCKRIQQLAPHEAKVSNVALSSEGRRCLSCSADKSAKLFVANESGQLQEKLHITDHSARVADAKFHPWLDTLFVTASYDGTFNLNDVEKGVLLTQGTGHKKGVHSVTFDEDGGLLVTGGLEGGIRIWDMRSGRCILTFGGAHADGVLGLGFRGGGGKFLLSCSADHSCKVWDLRRMKPRWTIPAHQNVVSGMGFMGESGRSTLSDLGTLALITGGYDGKVKVWAARRGWAFVRGWSCDTKIMAIDVGAYGIVGAGWDKKWRWWGLEKGTKRSDDILRD